MTDNHVGTILTFPTRNTSNGGGDKLVDELANIEAVLRSGAQRLRQLSADLDHQLQSGTLDHIGDPFATVTDMGEHIDRAHQDVTHAAEHVGAAIAAWQSASTSESEN